MKNRETQLLEETERESQASEERADNLARLLGEGQHKFEADVVAVGVGRDVLQA